MSLIFSLALMLSANASDATADAGQTVAATQGATQVKPEKKKKPKKICRTDTQDTGSRIMKRVCKTEEEWQSELDGRELQNKSQGY